MLYVWDSNAIKQKHKKHLIEHFTLETAQRWITDWQGEIMEEREFYPIIMHFKIKIYMCLLITYMYKH